ncbi:hypothetical protein JNW90_16065 [Micromonospora sp. STR1s_5]|nr:hypothetical protein [Micromonospora sp. STR1s_5]
MARYFFDIDDGDLSTRDDAGVELPGAEQARAQAVSVVPEIARDVLRADTETREITVRVRDAGGAEVYRALLSFRAEWTAGAPASEA